MKKLIFLLSLMTIALVGCSEEKFESYKEADEYLLKAVHDDKLDYETLKEKFGTEDNTITEEGYEALEYIAEVHLVHGATKEILREDNATMIYEKGVGSGTWDMAEVVIVWEYEDETYKINDIIHNPEILN